MVINNLTPSFKRAIEVALAGRFTVFLYPYVDHFDAMSAKELLVIQNEWNEISLKEFGYNVIVDDIEICTFAVEVLKPSGETITKSKKSKSKLQTETHEHILDRINEIKLKLEDIDDEINEGSRQIMKTCVDRFNMQDSVFQSVIVVAKVIAMLGNSKIIRTEHVAESIQHFMYFNKHIIPLRKSLTDVAQAFNNFTLDKEKVDKYREKMIESGMVKKVVNDMETFDIFQHYINNKEHNFLTS